MLENVGTATCALLQVKMIYIIVNTVQCECVHGKVWSTYFEQLPMGNLAIEAVARQKELNSKSRSKS